MQPLAEGTFGVESDEAWVVVDEVEEFADAPPPLVSSKILASGEFGGRLRIPFMHSRCNRKILEGYQVQSLGFV